MEPGRDFRYDKREDGTTDDVRRGRVAAVVTEDLGMTDARPCVESSDQQQQ